MGRRQAARYVENSAEHLCNAVEVLVRRRVKDANGPERRNAVAIVVRYRVEPAFNVPFELSERQRWAWGENETGVAASRSKPLTTRRAEQSELACLQGLVPCCCSSRKETPVEATPGLDESGRARQVNAAALQAIFAGKHTSRNQNIM